MTRVLTLPARAVCPCCGELVVVGTLGLMREHLAGTVRCAGSRRSAAGLGAELVGVRWRGRWRRSVSRRRRT